MVKDHSESEKGNPLPPHRLLFPISSKGSFICTVLQTRQHIPRQLYGITHMVKDHSDSGRWNPLSQLYWRFLPLSSKGSFICTVPQTGQNTPHHSLCYTSRGALAGTRNIAIYLCHILALCYTSRGVLAGTRNIAIYPCHILALCSTSRGALAETRNSLIQLCHIPAPNEAVMRMI